MSKKGWHILLQLALFLIALIFGLPYLASIIGKSYRERIEKNGTHSTAVVFRKNTHKGNSVHFKYNYKNKEYKNSEQNDSLFEALSIGDTISILLDSTKPSASYIIK